MPTWSQGCAHSQCDLPPTQQWKLAAAVVCSPVGPAPYWTSGTQPPFAPRHTCISLLLPKEPVGTRLSTGSPEAGAPLPVLGAGLGFRAPGTGSLRPGDPWAGASALAPLLTAAAQVWFSSPHSMDTLLSVGAGGAVAAGRQGGASRHVLTFAPNFQQVRPFTDVHLCGQAFLYQKYFLMRPFATPRMMLEMFFLSLKSRPFGFIFHARVWCTVCVQTCKDPYCGWSPLGALCTVVMRTIAWCSCQA